MKRKTLKLFLILGVIILSLLGFASCKETPPENPPEETVNLEELNDDALLDFVLNTCDSMLDYGGCSPGHEISGNLKSLYEKKGKILEFEVSGKSQLVLGYVSFETFEKIVKTSPLSLDSSYRFENTIEKYRTAKFHKNIDTEKDKFYLFTAKNKEIPVFYNEKVLAFVCEFYTLSFNDGTTAKVFLNHSGKMLVSDGNTEEAIFKPKNEIESISSFPYKSQRGIIANYSVSEYMWCNSFLLKAGRIEVINGKEYWAYSPRSCDEALLEAIKDYEKISVSGLDYISYSDIKNLLEIK